MTSQRVQISQQVVDLFVGQDVAEAFHLVASNSNDFADSDIIRGHPARAQVRLPEHALQAGTLASSRRVRRVTTVAVLIVNMATVRLLSIKPQFGVAFASLHFTA